MKVGEALARVIKDCGAQHLFTLTGAPQDMLLALDQTEGVSLVLGRSERSMLAMADGYARYTGRPAFTYAQFGPGVTALVGGLSDALWGFSPVVSIASGVGTAGRFRFAYQEVDQQAVTAPVVKWTGFAPEAARAPDVLARAVIEATSGAPGPVHVDVAANFFPLAMPEGPRCPVSTRHLQVPAQRTLAPADEIDTAAQILAGARRPLILAGGGVMISAAWNELTALARRLGAPVVTSMAGKGAIAETDPLAIGVCGVYSRTIANKLLREADVLLAVGTKLGAMPTDNFKLPAAGTRLVHMDIDARTIGRNFPTEASLVCDARAGLTQLDQALAGRGASPAAAAAWLSEAQAGLKAWRQRFDELAAEKTIEGRINPRFVMHTLNRFVRADDIVVADTGYSAGWAGTMVDVKAAGRHYLRAAGSLGWAFPAAIGIQLAAPGKRVLCLTGDGGLGYHLADLETALRVDAPTITIVLNNSTLGFEYTVQKLYYGRVSKPAHAFRETNYAAIAGAFGAHAERVEQPDELLPALQRAAQAGKAALIDVVSSPEVAAPYTRYENIPGQRDL